MATKPEPVISPTAPEHVAGFEWWPFCARCGGEMERVDCHQCGGDGVSGHDCGEDTCCCLWPEDNVECDLCRGDGHWEVCANNMEWCRKNAKPGREEFRGKIEWHAFAEGGHDYA